MQITLNMLNQYSMQEICTWKLNVFYTLYQVHNYKVNKVLLDYNKSIFKDEINDSYIKQPTALI
jgi:hypothetical protein